ncbi:MAG: hypothetical protein FWG51_03075, partial [Firmicutes bacterium]|nr:hypothetical protein [Bacillota bacterium]
MITKRRKTLLFSILFVCFILSLAVFNVRSQTAYALQGQGTETNPYIIDSTAALTEMRGLAVTQGVYFKQTQDITLSGQWTPIGTSSSPFRGNYDGDGFSINNLTITASRTDSGFFGYAGSSQNITTIKNMVFKNININFSSGNSTLYAGAVAAYVTGPVIIEGVRVESGTISMTAGTATGRFGGIIGHAAASTLTLTKSYNKAAVATNFGYAGGIVGSVVNPSNSKISVCFNEGPVTATASNQSSSSAVGGILGGVESGNGQITIEDSYNLGAVNATFTSPKATAGGIIGQSNMTASGSNKVEIITSFNAASVINTGGGGINGLVGGGTVSILSSFQYNSSFSNPYKSESEMKNGDGELGSESSNPWLGEGWYYNEGDFPTQEFFGVSPYFFITFDYNYLLSPAPVSIRTKAGETITQSAIPKPTRTVSGGGTADFVRWATANGSSTYVYNSSGNMTILVNEDLRGVTLYAEWDVRGLISVTFNYNYPANPGLSNYTYPTRASTVVSLLEHDFITEINASNPASVTSVTSTDVEFDFDNKWTSNSNGTGTEWIFDASGNLVQIIGVVEEPQVPIEEVPSILYAQWTNITQYANVTFYNAYTTPSSVAVRVAVGQNITTSNIPEPNRFGAAFNNWNTSSNGSGTAYTYSGAILSPAATALNRVTLYALWPLTQYTLEIDVMVFSGRTF